MAGEVGAAQVIHTSLMSGTNSGSRPSSPLPASSFVSSDNHCGTTPSRSHTNVQLRQGFGEDDSLPFPQSVENRKGQFGRALLLAKSSSSGVHVNPGSSSSSSGFPLEGCGGHSEDNDKSGETTRELEDTSSSILADSTRNISIASSPPSLSVDALNGSRGEQLPLNEAFASLCGVSLDDGDADDSGSARQKGFSVNFGSRVAHAPTSSSSSSSRGVAGPSQAEIESARQDGLKVGFKVGLKAGLKGPWTTSSANASNFAMRIWP